MENQIDTKNDLKLLIHTIGKASEAVRSLCDLADAVSQNLETLDRYNTAIKDRKTPLNYQEILELFNDNDHIKELLSNAEVERFDMGRLWLKPIDRQVQCGLDLMKGELSRALKDHFGMDFKIRVIAPKENYY